MDQVYDIVGHRVVFHVKGKKVEMDLRDVVWPISTFSLFYMLFMKKSGFESSAIDVVRPIDEDGDGSEESPYRPEDMEIPTIKGWLLMVYRRISRSPFGRSVMRSQSRKKTGVDIFLKLNLPEPPTFYPFVVPNESLTKLADENPIDMEALVQQSAHDGKFHFNTISDYIAAYRNQTVTPLDIARKVIKAIKNTEKPSVDGRKPNMRIMVEYHEDDILQLASESTERWKNNAPLSLFDGIHVAVKDEIFLAGYPCRQGLPVKNGWHDVVRSFDDEGGMVKRLREGGAIFIGMSNMHQLGLGITGINQSSLHGTARNPYNVQFPPGGSSSGSAVAVAAGLCPIGLGADGGGSIRLPASFCGVVGAKPSFGRVSTSGLCYGTDTLGSAGALCSTVRDSAITYAFLSGKDQADGNTLIQPMPFLLDFEKADLNGIKLGIDWAYFKHCEPEILEACEKGVNYLVEKRGAIVVDISIGEIKESHRAHIITILTEMLSYHKELYHKHHDELNVDTEMNLDLASTMTGEEYYKASKQRTRAMAIFRRLFKTVDCILTPAFANFTPKLDEATLEYGIADMKRLTEIMRYVAHSNLTGVPSICVPVSYSADEGLPIALQIITSWWREDLMFRIAHALEDSLERRAPQVYFDLIKGDIADPTSDDESE